MGPGTPPSSPSCRTMCDGRLCRCGMCVVDVASEVVPGTLGNGRESHRGNGGDDHEWLRRRLQWEMVKCRSQLPIDSAARSCARARLRESKKYRYLL